ncbi:MAG: hypothetical protein GW939_03955 [Candidatus Magasanikbacteria bacterium]|uniref:Guanylate kinase-like domain-containing protein n=3 Tax=Candidatus Roizmaniibacteriota TaxID=1752723 RepID=A0A2H0C4D1_9BACT|nr:hypothetical protein [Candidatus Magasanikbacteria bacterium]PIP64651.1 MAG: hypothetical protein COW96_01355 [Candidatus Roizmanbacteria bacterium CG22_combo_CG10-13_8_21_14_all_33_16]PIX74622.1 MAG: hypothetical protein COZ39_00065 [Candidatus Roizmanbacteria bacterium CG_4_10_14_3_um_filter_33_21]PJB89080.1 MAG: hypothetical protein CO083_01295 [Candidatus Roizmanbacteria bacterium CG_4_9_14_0_8_um_filter_34_12]
MSNQGKIFALTGPSGVGKGFIKQHIKLHHPHLEQLTVATTRGKRPDDGKDRETGIPIGVFLERRNGGTIVFAHQPFGPEGDWYGFYAEQIQRLLADGKQVLTEIHVDNVGPFKTEFGEKVKILGLIADEMYLESNLICRGSETEEDRQHRLDLALKETEVIAQLVSQGLVDSVIEVNDDNREIIAQLALEKMNELGLEEVNSFRVRREYE